MAILVIPTLIISAKPITNFFVLLIGEGLQKFQRIQNSNQTYIQEAGYIILYVVTPICHSVQYGSFFPFWDKFVFWVVWKYVSMIPVTLRTNQNKTYQSERSTTKVLHNILLREYYMYSTRHVKYSTIQNIVWLCFPFLKW